MDMYIAKLLKECFGLKQTALLAYNFLVKNLKPYGYYSIPYTIRMWKHKTHPILFCLCVIMVSNTFIKKMLSISYILFSNVINCLLIGKVKKLWFKSLVELQ